MKYVQMEYPDGTIHNTLVTGYKHSQDKDVDFIEYFDMTDNKKLYTIIKDIDGTIFKDSIELDYTYDELAKNSIKKDIKDLPDMIDNIKVNSKSKKNNYELEFEVYYTDTGLYIASSIAEAFHLNKNYKNKKINNVICVPVSEEEIKRIEIISSQGVPALKARTINLHNIAYQSQALFIVYEVEELNKFFVQEEICRKYKVGKGMHYINGVQCREVEYEDIHRIEELSKNDNPCLKARFVKLSFSNTKESLKVYKNPSTNKMYLENNICEENNIGKGIHYIDNKLYKEVTKEEINKINKKYNIKYKDLKFKNSIKDFIVYVDELSNRFFIENSIAKDLELGKGTHYIGDKLCKEITIQEIKDIVKSTKYSDIKYEPKYLFLTFDKKKKINEENNISKTIVYKDVNNNNKLYAKKEDCIKYNIGNKEKFKYINNQECYEISLIDLTKIVKPVIKTVHLQKEISFKKKETKEEKKRFLVCKFDKFYFISYDLAIKYDIAYKAEIKVDGEKFVQIRRKDIQKIEELSNMEREIIEIVQNNKEEDLNQMLDDKYENKENESNKKIK